MTLIPNDRLKIKKKDFLFENRVDCDKVYKANQENLRLTPTNTVLFGIEIKDKDKCDFCTIASDSMLYVLCLIIAKY